MDLGAEDEMGEVGGERLSSNKRGSFGLQKVGVMQLTLEQHRGWGPDPHIYTQS